EIEQRPQRGARLRLAERVTGEGGRAEDVGVGRADIVVTAQDEHLLARQQGLGALGEAVHPGDLVGELFAADGIAVRQIKAADRERSLWRLDLAFDVARGFVRHRLWQAASGDLDRKE